MSENPFAAFTPKKEWLVCVDSDGCAMDKMCIRDRDDWLYVCHNTRGEIMTSYSWDHLCESYMIDLNVKYGYDGKESKYRCV